MIERYLGEVLDISHGTAMAIESWLKKKENNAPVSMWFNIKTLIRNIIQSYEKEVFFQLKPEVIIKNIYDEMETIAKAFSQASFQLTNIQYYICEHKNIKSYMPYALIKEPKTPKQIFYSTLEKDIIKNLDKDCYINFENQWLGDRDLNLLRTILLTHHPIDLLQHRNVSNSNMLLLETMTGSVKDSSDWNTKLHGGSEKLTHIPFNKFTLQIFGDGNMISMQSRNLRNFILAMAKEKEWTSQTSYDKISMNIKDLKDKPMSILLLKILRS